MTQVTILNVVIASPDDVADERNALQEIINELNRGIARSKDIRLELIGWKTDSYPGFHPDGPQGLIDPILNIEDCDVFIGIFWKRFSSPVKDADSGTEHEFLQAYSAWKNAGTPRIMFYFNQKPHTLNSSSEAEQMRRVMNFKENFPNEGLWWAYNGEVEFERQVRNHLTKFVIDYSDSETSEDEEVFVEENTEDEPPEPILLHDEQIGINAKSSEFYGFNLESENTLIVSIKSTEAVNIVIVDHQDVNAWLANEGVDEHVFHENKKRIRFNFKIEEDGEYAVIISNNTFFTEAEVDVKISYLE